MTDESEYIGGFHVNQLTPSVCQRLVQSNGNLLFRMPQRLRTEEVRLAAVKAAPNIIKKLDRNEITHEMYHAAIEKNSKLAEFAPDSIKTFVEHYEKWKNEQISFAELEKNTSNDNLQYMYSAVVSWNYTYLKYVPVNYRTREMCLHAIDNYQYNVFSYIPSCHLDQDMYDRLVEKKLVELANIPRQYLSSKIINKFVDEDSRTLLKLPEEVITKELVMYCVFKKKFKLREIPPKFLDRDIYTLHTSKYVFNIYDIPVEYWTEHMVLVSIGLRTINLESIPDHLKTEAVKFAATCVN